jgi:hypothetical protein
MANIPIWPGSASFHPGDTPFGFYDNDPQFEADAPKVCVFCARRMGYPIVDIELQAKNFYAAFEEAVTIYGNELYAYKIRDNYLSLEGAPTDVDINETIVTPNLGRIIKLSEQYGAEAGTGGNVPWHKGKINLTASVQDYDLNAWAVENGYKDKDIEIMRVFYEPTPAVIKFFDPYVGSGTGMMNMMDSFGWGNYSPAVNFMMMPINYDVAVMQEIELSDTIRRSNFSFEMHDNVLRVFPIPMFLTGSTHPSGSAGHMWFEFMLNSERNSASFEDGYLKIKAVSGVPYKNPKYSEINSVGRSWIFEMTLALAKEMLGYVRGKYTQVPIPGAEVTLNQADLLGAAKAEREALLEKLRAFFDETSREKLLERRTLESDFVMKELDKVPRPIYIG